MPGWALKKTEAYGYVSIVLVEDMDPGARLKAGGKASKKPRDVSDEALKLRAVAAARRARGNMGWKLRMLRADRLWTLTKRGRIVSRGEAWSLWGEFERVMSRRFPWFKCVVVIEAHKLDGYHIHFAVNRWMPVDGVRLIWHRVLTGEKLRTPLRGVEAPGNVDVEYRPLTIRKLCSYMGKYLSKGFDSPEEAGLRFKRYAASKGIDAPLVTRRRMVVTLGGVADIAASLRTWLSLDGYVPSDLFEVDCVPGRRALWMCAEKPDPLGT